MSTAIQNAINSKNGADYKIGCFRNETNYELILRLERKSDSALVSIRDAYLELTDIKDELELRIDNGTWISQPYKQLCDDEMTDAAGAEETMKMLLCIADELSYVDLDYEENPTVVVREVLELCDKIVELENNKDKVAA